MPISSAPIVDLRQRHARRRLDERSHRVRQSENAAVGARIVAAGLGSERIEPEPVAAVGADFQLQVLHRVDHPLVFVIFLQQRIGLDHAFDQLGGAAEFPGLRIDRDRDAVAAHHGEHGPALEYVLVVDLGAEFAVQLRAQAHRDIGRAAFGLAIGWHVDRNAAPAHALDLHHERAAHRCAQKIDTRPHRLEQAHRHPAIFDAVVLQQGDLFRRVIGLGIGERPHVLLVGLVHSGHAVALARLDQARSRQLAVLSPCAPSRCCAAPCTRHRGRSPAAGTATPHA